MNKLTDEQLSRIISLHENNGLAQWGYTYQQNKSELDKKVCLYQAAGGVTYLVSTDIDGNDLITQWEVRSWFDSKYNSEWTTEEFISELHKFEVV